VTVAGDKVLRQALFAWAFNPATRDTAPPPKIADALDWAERASLPGTAPVGDWMPRMPRL